MLKLTSKQKQVAQAKLDFHSIDQQQSDLDATLRDKILIVSNKQ
jgi:hypothetical protein